MVYTGVKQGDILSPTLFSIFLNDFAIGIKDLGRGVNIFGEEISLLLYADDIVLLAENEANLQKMLDYLHDYCFKNRLTVNMTKSEIVHFRHKNKNRTNFAFKLGEKIVKYTEVYRYLGIHLNEHLDFCEAEKVLAESSGRALSSIINKFKNLGNIGYRTFTKLYESGVVPIMDYGSEVWGKDCSSNGTKTQNRAIRYFLGVHRFAPIAAINGDMGWDSCNIRRLIRMIRLWNRLLDVPNTRLVKRIFLADCNANVPNTWAHEIKDIFRLIDCNLSYDSLLYVNVDFARKKLSHIENNQWSNTVESKPKLRTYKLFKHNYGTEDYVLDNLSRSERSFLAQLRCGILPLRIETGRFSRLELEQRICQLCNSNLIESEEHFIFSCSFYTEFRNQYYDMLRNLDSNFNINLEVKEKWKIIMNRTCVKTTSKFITKCYLKRKDFLSNEQL